MPDRRQSGSFYNSESRGFTCENFPLEICLPWFHDSMTKQGFLWCTRLSVQTLFMSEGELFSTVSVAEKCHLQLCRERWGSATQACCNLLHPGMRTEELTYALLIQILKYLPSTEILVLVVRCTVTHLGSKAWLRHSPKFSTRLFLSSTKTVSPPHWYPFPESVQGQDGGGFQQPGLVESIPAHGRGWNEMVFKVPSNPDLSLILLQWLITLD